MEVDGLIGVANFNRMKEFIDIAIQHEAVRKVEVTAVFVEGLKTYGVSSFTAVCYSA